MDPNIIVSLNHIGIYPLKQSYLSFIQDIHSHIDGIEIMYWGHTQTIEAECNRVATEETKQNKKKKKGKKSYFSKTK